MSKKDIEDRLNEIESNNFKQQIKIAHVIVMLARSRVADIRDMTYEMFDLARTWRYKDELGTINDEHIQKLKELKKDVFEVCDAIIDIASMKGKYNNDREEAESVNKIIDEISQVIDRVNQKFDAFSEYYEKLSKIYFKEEYDR